MYYLKYRPQKISELDNPKIKEMLQSLLSQKEIPHAFLFIGQRGTGKTSTARILAKAVNCLNNKFAGKGGTVDACNECSICLQIKNDSSPDVVELDAASNRGIEDIKNLIKEAYFAPMTTRYKVFIIDEAHMITTDAFNALLKTLEEPPKNTIFILATTNPEKLLETIKSRCIILNFGSVRKEHILHMLKRIAQAENLKVDEKTLNLIAEISNLSFRDAAKILEELVLLNKLSFDEALKHLKVRDNTTLLNLILKKEIQKALEWVEEYYNQGGDIKSLIAILLKEVKERTLRAVSKGKKEEIKELAALIKLLQTAYQELKFTPFDIIPLELAILEFYNQFKLKI